MKFHFCTITTKSHLYKVQALATSLQNQGQEFLLHVLLIDEAEFSFPNCRVWKLHDVATNEAAKAIISKYKSNKDKLRWSLKGVMMKHLLLNAGAEEVIYLDNDLYFYSNYSFLFDLLKEHNFLLIPHYYKNNPKQEQNWFEANFRVGLFNAGFVGANASAINTLQWWADCCLYRCEKNSFRGFFDDQKYLDLVPVIEEKAHIVRHKGCDIAGWNKELCRREIVGTEVKIDGVYPIVFIHFNDTTVREIINGGDELLFNHYRDYVEVLKQFNEDLKEKDLLVGIPLQDKLKLGIWKIITEFGI